MKPQELNEAGLIYGESASQGGLNVSKRLRLLNRLRPLGGGVAVDLGCGKGSYSPELAGLYDVTMAIDILPQNLMVARERLQPARVKNVHFCCASSGALPIADASVDSVFMIEVLDHVPELASCFDEVLRVLKPGGVFYVTVPNHMFPWETHPVRLFGVHKAPAWFPLLPWFGFLHRRMATARVFSRRSLRQLAGRVGLVPIRMDTAYPPLENRGGSRLRSFLDRLDATPLRAFGVILAAAFLKPASQSARVYGATNGQ